MQCPFWTALANFSKRTRLMSKINIIASPAAVSHVPTPGLEWKNVSLSPYWSSCSPASPYRPPEKIHAPRYQVENALELPGGLLLWFGLPPGGCSRLAIKPWVSSLCSDRTSGILCLKGALLLLYKAWDVQGRDDWRMQGRRKQIVVQIWWWIGEADWWYRVTNAINLKSIHSILLKNRGWHRFRWAAETRPDYDASQRFAATKLLEGYRVF